MRKFKPIQMMSAAALMGTAALGIAGHALAADGRTDFCVIYDVDVDTNASRLTLHCAGDTNTYTAGYSGCAATNVDQIKIWHSQAMAAMLSGNKSTLWWNNACGSRAMYGFLTAAQ
jgi:hypothetical protein